MRGARPAVILFLLVPAVVLGQDGVGAAAAVALEFGGGSMDAAGPEPPTPRVGVVGSTLGARFASEAPAPLETPAPALPPLAAPVPTPPLNPLRVAAAGVGSASAVLAVVDHQRRKWWPERQDRFRIENDWEYSRWADKAGHFIVAAFLTRSYRSTLRWSGVPVGRARAWGAGAAWASMLYYEVLDGFGPHWGFSPGDLLFNTLGVAFATGQEVVPALQAVEVRVGYWPSGWSGKAVVDDYAGQTYWLTVNPGRLAPIVVPRWVPRWLGMAVGYGARDPDEFNMLRTSVVLAGLDIDLAGIGIAHPVWRAFVSVFRYLRVPAPAVRVYPDLRFVPFAF